MYRLLPLLLLLAVSPESEKKLETLNSFVIAAKDTVTSIRNGVETFQAAMMPFMTGQETNKSGSPSSKQQQNYDNDIPEQNKTNYSQF